MILRRFTIFFLLILLAISASAQEISKKPAQNLIEDLKSDDRKISDAAFEELVNRNDEVVYLLESVAQQTDANQFVIARAVGILGKIKNPHSVPILINLLDHKESFVRGVSAYALSQIGDKRAKLALLNFLERSLDKDHENLPRAIEAIKELPDAKAFPSLMKILIIAKEQESAPKNRNTEKDVVQNGTLRYAIEALGEIGDSRASVAIAEFLQPNDYYVNNYDWAYLRSIYKTGGTEVVPYLIAYLEKITEKLKNREMPNTNLGAGNKQIIYHFMLHKQTIANLEIITGQKSKNTTREDVLIFWKNYWQVNEYK